VVELGSKVTKRTGRTEAFSRKSGEFVDLAVSEDPDRSGIPAHEGFVKRRSSVACAPAVGSMGTPALKYSTTSRNVGEDTALWKKFPGVSLAAAGFNGAET